MGLSGSIVLTAQKVGRGGPASPSAPPWASHSPSWQLRCWMSGSGELRGHNQSRAEQRFSPASSFTIANAPIGLSVGAVQSVDEVIPCTGDAHPSCVSGGTPLALAWAGGWAGCRWAIRSRPMPSIPPWPGLLLPPSASNPGTQACGPWGSCPAHPGSLSQHQDAPLMKTRCRRTRALQSRPVCP